MKIFARQGKWTFHASARGHVRLKSDSTLLLRPRHDWFFTYYREKAIPIGLGIPLRDIFLTMLNRGGDSFSASSGEFVGDGERQRAVLVRNWWNLRHVESKDLC